WRCWLRWPWQSGRRDGPWDWSPGAGTSASAQAWSCSGWSPGTAASPGAEAPRGRGRDTPARFLHTLWMMTDDIVQRRPEGLYRPPGRFYIDPWLPVDTAVLTHGHGDHARP